MKKTTIFSVCIVLYSLQSYRINAAKEEIPEEVGGTEESGESTTNVRSNNAIAKLIGVKSGHDNEWLAAVPDNSSDSGYAVRIGPYFNSITTKYYYQVFMYAFSREQPHFRQYFYGSQVCDLVSNDTRYTSMPKDPFIPRQIARMIFTGVTNDCRVLGGNSSTPYTSPMISTARVNANRKDQKYRTVGIPIRGPFELMVNVINYDDSPHEDTSYIFQVNFTVEEVDESGGAKTENGRSGYRCLNTRWNYWILWRICSVYEFLESIFGL